MFDRKNGRMEVELKRPIEDVAVSGKMETCKTLVFFEPVHESESICLRIVQFIRSFSFGAISALKGLRGKEKEEIEEPVGEKIVPLHREEVDPKEIDKEAKSFVEMIISSGIDPEEFLLTARILFTRTFKSRERSNLCAILFEGKEVEMTPELWEKLSIADKLYCACLYYSFFDLSSIGQR